METKMSADRWSVCPRCTDRKRGELNADEEALQLSYGVISAAEFIKAQAVFVQKSKDVTAMPEEFREDYSVYAEDGVVTVQYLGSCTRCGLRTDFTHEHPFYPKD